MKQDCWSGRPEDLKGCCQNCKTWPTNWSWLPLKAGACPVQRGVCPEHGNTLTSSGSKT